MGQTLLDRMRSMADGENQRAAALDPARLYFVDGSGNVVNDAQVDEHARALGGDYRDALQLAGAGLRRYGGEPIETIEERSEITDVDVDRAAKELMQSDARLVALAESDWCQAYAVATQLAAAGKRIVHA